jgi:hypothetical protein
VTTRRGSSRERSATDASSAGDGALASDRRRCDHGQLRIHRDGVAEIPRDYLPDLGAGVEPELSTVSTRGPHSCRLPKTPAALAHERSVVRCDPSISDPIIRVMGSGRCLIIAQPFKMRYR